MSDHADLRYAEVRCRECGKEYTCTPDQDYYNATNNTDGLCWDCLLKAKDAPPGPEPAMPAEEDEVIGVKLIGGPQGLDGWNNAYPADRLGGWPPPDEIAAFNIGGLVAVSIPDNVPDDFTEFVTLYRKIKQSDLPAPGPNIFRGATYQAVES